MKLNKYEIIRILCLFSMWVSAHIENIIKNLEIVMAFSLPAIILVIITYILEK